MLDRPANDRQARKLTRAALRMPTNEALAQARSDAPSAGAMALRRNLTAIHCRPGNTNSPPLFWASIRPPVDPCAHLGGSHFSVSYARTSTPTPPRSAIPLATLASAMAAVSTLWRHRTTADNVMSMGCGEILSLDCASAPSRRSRPGDRFTSRKRFAEPSSPSGAGCRLGVRDRIGRSTFHSAESPM